MGKPKITLYVDILSPFAYMAFYMTRHSSIFEPCEITYVPILLGGLIRMCQNIAPMDVKNKDKWISVERLRWAKQFNIPMSRDGPLPFPVPTLQTQRTLAGFASSNPDLLPIALDALYESLWVDANAGTASDPEVFGAIMDKAFRSREDKEAVKRAVARRNDPEVKKILTDNTQRAMEAGAFGLPWFECENSDGRKEGFWGFDHLGQVVGFLGLNGRGEIRALL